MLLALFAVIAVALAALTCGANSLGFWVGIPIALGYMLAVFAVFLLVVVSTLLVRTDRPMDHQNRYYHWLIYNIIETAKTLLRVRVHVTGMEKIPKDTRFMLVSNHRAIFDPPITMNIFKDYQMAFISKKENYNIPIVNKLMHACCCLPLDREDNRAAIKTIAEAANLLKNDVATIGIYPEGTCNKTEAPLLPFRNGAFKIAQKAKVPIVVMTIHNTREIFDNAPWRPTDIYAHILAVIPCSEDAHQQTKDIADQIWPMMEEDMRVAHADS